MTLAEEYRPRTLGEIVGQPTHEIRQRLSGRSTPNFLLYGPPGTGKTTAARAIARELQGNSDAFLELNAADTGVEEIRTLVERAGRQLTLEGSPPVIVLDEMETMGYDAQQALKKRMEEFPAVFILITNDQTLKKINDALVDRCSAIEFDKVPTDAIEDRLKTVARKEGLDVDDDKLRQFAVFANGSVRTALQKLSSVRSQYQRPDQGWRDRDTDKQADGGFLTR